MASVSHEKKTGRRTVQFVGDNGKRRSIRLGKVNKRQAESAKLFIEDLLHCKVTGTSPKGTTAEWIAGLPDAIRQRIERTGLLGPQERRECPTLDEWLRQYIEGRRDVKPATATVYGHTRRNLLAFFGTKQRLDEITAGDAEDFRIFLRTDEGLAENTVRRRCGIAKQFLRSAVRKKVILENPFDGLPTVIRENPKRFHFVSREETQTVLDACPDAEWRLIFALCRYAGLRCPTEVLRLKWGDIDWEHMRFTVHASKTEHHADAGIRQVPIFPELYPFLRDCFEQAEPGSEWVITRYREHNENLRTQMGKIILRSGLTPWPKVFQNLRSTRETELAEKFPIQVVCKWIGNSPQVASKHYLQVTEEHFQKAVQNPVQYPAATPSTDSQHESQHIQKPAIYGPLRNDATPCESKNLQRLGRTGLEPVTLRV